MSLDADQYLKERVDDQARYYNNRSKRHKRSHLSAATLTVTASALIPIMAFAISSRLPVIAIGIFTSIIVSLQSIFKWQENYLKFRRACEELIREKFFYLTGTGPYFGYKEEQQSLHVLTSRVENLLAEEQADWQNRVGPDG